MKLKADAKRHTIVIDGQHYIVQEADNGEHEMVKIDVKEYDKKIKEISEKLIDAVDKKMLMADVLVNMTKNDIYELHDKLFKSKRKPTPKMQPGCVEMKVGSTVIPIRN